VRATKPATMVSAVGPPPLPDLQPLRRGLGVRQVGMRIDPHAPCPADLAPSADD
jgi:hypothetical protein